MKTCADCWLASETFSHNAFDCRLTGIRVALPGSNNCKARITDEDIGIEAVLDEQHDEKEESLICASCSCASTSDVRIFPTGISNSFDLPDGVLYCSERKTRVPSILKGCELHQKKEVDIIGCDFAKEKSATAYVYFVPVEDIRDLRPQKTGVKRNVGYLESHVKVLESYIKETHSTMDRLYDELDISRKEIEVLSEKLRLSGTVEKQSRETIDRLTRNCSRVTVHRDAWKKRFLDLYGEWRLLGPREEMQTEDEIMTVKSGASYDWVCVDRIHGTLLDKLLKSNRPVRRRIE